MAITAEKTATTGNVSLDMLIPLMTDEELAKLADYARFLVWLRDNRESQKCE
ncbi:MAG: hypothetical protein IJU07_08275 [Synergistaceae bacterium]|nr:hypothetical protein [Synergistaceae bacterium]